MKPEILRQTYPKGTRVLLDRMSGEAQMPEGMQGEVFHVDDIGQIHVQWDNGSTLALIPGEDSFSVLSRPRKAAEKEQKAVSTVKFYCPATVTCYSRNEDGDMDDYPDTLSHADAAGSLDAVLEQIKKEVLDGEEKRGLMVYYHVNDDIDKSVDTKILSSKMSAEVVDDRLYGVAVCEIQGELTGQEIERFYEYISGQMSDGWGEGFEQRPLQYDGEEIYVSFWNSDKDWHIRSESDMGLTVPQEQPQTAPEAGGQSM